MLNKIQDMNQYLKLIKLMKITLSKSAESHHYGWYVIYQKTT